MTKQNITVVGAGIVGLWQALTLARAGHKVQLLEALAKPYSFNASALGGAMLSPFCESETAEPAVRDLGVMALPIWLETLRAVVRAGSLVVAGPRDQPELTRFARLTDSHRKLDADEIAALEPDLDGRFASALYFESEAHMAPGAALEALTALVRRAGVDIVLGRRWTADVTARDATAYVIDCRGMAARDDLPDLRGVRGERLVIRTKDLQLGRPVRLLHPRHPLYVVPWPDSESQVGRPLQSSGQPSSGETEQRNTIATSGLYMVGSTLIESEDDGPMTVRSALELLGMTYALHPAFAEAQILDMSAGVRPAFADNVPKIIVRDRHIYVNGMYRHGFLTAPALARLVADYIASGKTRDDVFA